MPGSSISAQRNGKKFFWPKKKNSLFTNAALSTTSPEKKTFKSISRWTKMFAEEHFLSNKREYTFSVDKTTMKINLTEMKYNYKYSKRMNFL
jgi:hypothetical protein